LINDLLATPGLKFDVNPDNSPLDTREFILTLLEQIQPSGWWNISSFINFIHEHYADFERHAGDYDSWFVRSAQNGEYLRGFDHWQQVEGANIKYLLTGPFHLLGILDVGSSSQSGEPDSVRFSAWSDDLIKSKSPNIAINTEKIFIRSNGLVIIPRNAARSARYTVARFCDWLGFDGQNYKYQITGESFDAALSQGLKIKHLLKVFKIMELHPPRHHL